MRLSCKTWLITSTTYISNQKSFLTRWKTRLSFHQNRSQQTFWSMTMGKNVVHRNGPINMSGTTMKNLQLAGKTHTTLSKKKSLKKWTTMEQTYKKWWVQQTVPLAIVQTKRSERWPNSLELEKNWCVEWPKSRNSLMIKLKKAALHRVEIERKKEFLNWQKKLNLQFKMGQGIN